MRYVQLLSGFVGTYGWLCWSCFTIVEMSCNRDFESDRVVLGEGVRSYLSLSVLVIDDNAFAD